MSGPIYKYYLTRVSTRAKQDDSVLGRPIFDNAYNQGPVKICIQRRRFGLITLGMQDRPARHFGVWIATIGGGVFTLLNGALACVPR